MSSTFLQSIQNQPSAALGAGGQLRPESPESPLLTMAYLSKESRRVMSRPNEVADFWRQVLEPAWGEQINQPLVAVVLMDENFKAHSVMPVGFGSRADLAEPLIKQLIPALRGLVDALVVITGRMANAADPLAEDFAFTRRLKAAAGKKVTLHDHIIIGGENYFSFYESKWPISARTTKKLRVRWLPRLKAPVVHLPQPQEPYFPIPCTDLIAA